MAKITEGQSSMSSSNARKLADSIRSELNLTRSSFHAILDSFTEEDWGRQSLNAGWSNNEILSHVLFGFIILNVLLPMARLWGRLPKSSSKPFAWLLNTFTRPFNWINAYGARMQGRVFNRKRIGKLFDTVYFALLNKIDTIRDDEWDRGMYYPTKWDSNFNEFMTLEKLFYYPIIHYKFHVNQLSR
jgi:hypothetical protein